MTHRFSLLLLFWLLLVSPQLATCGESRYPVLDSKFPAAEAKLGWLDNERVIFHGGAGDDFLWRDCGADILVGGNGTDYLNGGVANDASYRNSFERSAA